MKGLSASISLAAFCIPVCLSACLANQPHGLDSPESSASIASSDEKKGLYPPLDPGFAGAEACAACHEGHYDIWKEGGHNKVPCETCHGPAGGHIRLNANPRRRMNLPGEAKHCLTCHGGSNHTVSQGIPQVESLEAHVNFVGEKHSVKTDVKKTNGRCIFCHDPHSLE